MVTRREVPARGRQRSLPLRVTIGVRLYRRPFDKDGGAVTAGRQVMKSDDALRWYIELLLLIQDYCHLLWLCGRLRKFHYVHFLFSIPCFILVHFSNSLSNLCISSKSSSFLLSLYRDWETEPIVTGKQIGRAHV